MRVLSSLLLLALLPGAVTRDFLSKYTGEADFVQEQARQARGAIAQKPRRQQNSTPNMMAMKMAEASAAMKSQMNNLRTGDARAAASPVVRGEDKRTFDFIVAGFPKCGTTSLLKAFDRHAETDMAPSEQCAIAAPKQADVKVHKSLDNTLATLDPTMKNSFKCPTAMYNYKSITRLEKHSPRAKLIIGMRHPVEMMQSFYNYRVTEIRERQLDQMIPPFEEILESGMPWKGVSTTSTRFEIFLMQLGKTPLATEQLTDLAGQNYDLAIKPTKFTVFLYTVDQMEDGDADRSEAFRREMQNYLGLREPIPAFKKENKNRVTHPESIKICDPQWASVRAQLVEQGAITAAWLRDHFLQSKDVVVANRQHFLESLESWGTDPCEATA